MVCYLYLNETCKYTLQNKCAIELSSLHVLDTKHLSKTWFVNIFSHFTGCLFTLLIVFFTEQKSFSLIQSYLSIFAFADNVLLGS